MIRVALVAAWFATISASAGAYDPDWPCQQIRVPELSLAAVWSGPAVDPRQSKWQDDRQLADLVQKLTPRREPLEQADGLIRDFAQRAGDQKQARMLALLAGVFDVLSQERDSVMSGLDRFGSRQKELAAQIRADNEQLHVLQTDSTADQGVVQQITQKVQWEVELFQDRRQAVTYACDAPTKIEQRLFALAHQIQQAME